MRLMGFSKIIDLEYTQEKKCKQWQQEAQTKGPRKPAHVWIGDVFRPVSLSSCFIIAHIWGLCKHPFS